MSDVEGRLAALESRVNELEDLNAIRRLQMAYGYYIDYNRPEEVAGLFAEDGAVVFLSGEYRGHAGVMRLYGTWFQNLFTGGRRGPVKGLLLDHFQLQDVITVAPDRQTAKGRFRGLLAGGWHDAIKDKLPEGMPQEVMSHLQKTWVVGQQLRISRWDGSHAPSEHAPRKGPFRSHGDRPHGAPPRKTGKPPARPHRKGPPKPHGG